MSMKVPGWLWKKQLKEEGEIVADLTENLTEIEAAAAALAAQAEALRLTDDQEWRRQQTVRGEALTSNTDDPRNFYSTDPPPFRSLRQARSAFVTTGPLFVGPVTVWAEEYKPPVVKPPEPVEPVQWEFKRQIKMEDE